MDKPFFVPVSQLHQWIAETFGVDALVAWDVVGVVVPGDTSWLRYAIQHESYRLKDESDRVKVRMDYTGALLHCNGVFFAAWSARDSCWVARDFSIDENESYTPFMCSIREKGIRVW